MEAQKPPLAPAAEFADIANLPSNSNPSETSSVQPVIQKHNPGRIFKIIVIGDSNVGKTCLTFRFCAGRFPDKTEATIGVDFREKATLVDNENIKLQLWDTAGQERFRKSMVQHYYRNVHAVVFVYDVTKISSFENMPHWIDECDRHNLTQDVPRLIIGNKCDMKDKAVVNTNKAQRFADMHNMPLFETSAKDDSQTDHVEAIFMTMAHKLKSSKPMMPSTLPGYVYPSGSEQVIELGPKRPSLQYDEREEKEECAC